MDVNEREAALTLSSYFSKDRIVFDVGSNKGEWSDMFVGNCEVHLFEPNIKLLHYTEIKYAYLRNVSLVNCAIGNSDKTEDFFLFHHEFNGLSSFFENQEWKNLPHTFTNINVRRIDSLPIDHIDFLKIDVEGAEWLVIQGAEEFIKRHKIKFIQIEYSEHYKIPGYKFQTIIDFMAQYGYLLYEYTDHFRRPKQFIENYEHKNYYFMQKFTEDWNAEFKKNTKGMKFNLVLEVGCFEGLTTCYIADFLLKDGGRIVCIDPLREKYLTDKINKEAKEMNKAFKMFKGQYDRFIHNTKDKPVELYRMRSDECFKQDVFNKYRFDLIYLDGDHRESAVYNDAISCWNVLADHGYLLFDDYKWREETKRGIDRFLSKYKGYYYILKKDYQVMIQKNIP